MENGPDLYMQHYCLKGYRIFRIALGSGNLKTKRTDELAKDCYCRASCFKKLHRGLIRQQRYLPRLLRLKPRDSGYCVKPLDMFGFSDATCSKSFALGIMENKRSAMGMSVAELSRRTNINKKRLWYVLNGQREMRIDEFLKLCVALRLDPRSFVTREMVEEVAGTTRRSIGRSDGIGI